MWAARRSAFPCSAIGLEPPKHNNRRREFNGAVSTKREQRRAPCPPSSEKRNCSLGAHPSDCDRLHPAHSPESIWSNRSRHGVILAI